MEKSQYKEAIVFALTDRKIMDIFQACEYFDQWWNGAISGNAPLIIHGFTKQESIDLLTEADKKNKPKNK